jgi:hypothetical protein
MGPGKNLYKAAAACAVSSVLFTIAGWTSLGWLWVFPGKLGILARARLIWMQPWEWSLPFILTAAAALVLVPVVLAIGEQLADRPASSRIALAHGLIGVTLASISQFMQATVARKAALQMMLKNHERAKSAYLAQSMQWNIEYHYSTAYGLAMLGQAFMAVALLCLGLAWVREPGLKKFTAVLCLVSVPAQAVGLAGYVLDQEPLLAGAMAFDILFPVILTFLFICFLRSARTG